MIPIGKTLVKRAALAIKSSVATVDQAHTKHDSGNSAKPCEPACLGTQGVDVRDSSDESRQRSPDDDEPDSNRPADDFTNLSRVGVHRRVVPDDIFGNDFNSGLNVLPALLLVDVSGKDMSLVLGVEPARVPSPSQHGLTVSRLQLKRN
jgi:hypothetical protein